MSQLALVPNSHARTPSHGRRWLTALRAGHPSAIAECYSQHGDALMALAGRLTGNRQGAEHAVHDLFVRLPEAIRAYEERGQFESWLKRLTVRIAMVQQRRTLRRRETLRIFRLFSLAAVHSCKSTDGTEMISAIGDALRRLSPTLRCVFVLRMIEGYSHADIADTLNISIYTSETHLGRAISVLRGALGGRVTTFSLSYFRTLTKRMAAHPDSRTLLKAAESPLLDAANEDLLQHLSDCQRCRNYVQDVRDLVVQASEYVTQPLSDALLTRIQLSRAAEACTVPAMVGKSKVRSRATSQRLLRLL